VQSAVQVPRVRAPVAAWRTLTRIVFRSPRVQPIRPAGTHLRAVLLGGRLLVDRVQGNTGVSTRRPGERQGGEADDAWT
jgi:hypothetical protein